MKKLLVLSLTFLSSIYYLSANNWINENASYEEITHAYTSNDKRYFKIKPSKKITFDKNTIIRLQKYDKYDGIVYITPFHSSFQIRNKQLVDLLIAKNRINQIRRKWLMAFAYGSQ